MTGIVKSVGRSFSKSSDSPAEAPDNLDNAGSGGSLFGSPKVLGVGVVAVIAVLGIGFWLFSGSDESAPAIEPSVATPSITEAEPVLDDEPPVEMGPTVDAMLEEA